MKNLLIFLLMSSTLLSQEKYIHAGKIYDSNSGKYHLNKTIIVSENIISSGLNPFYKFPFYIIQLSFLQISKAKKSVLTKSVLTFSIESK